MLGPLGRGNGGRQGTKVGRRFRRGAGGELGASLTEGRNGYRYSGMGGYAMKCRFGACTY